MKRVSVLVMIVVAVLLVVSPASASYTFNLQTWNITTNGNPVTDYVHVIVDTNTIEFQWVPGNVSALAGNPKNFLDIWWDASLGDASSNSDSYVSVTSVTGFDGFTTGNGYPAYTTKYNNAGACTTPTDLDCQIDVTFNFGTTTLPTTLIADDFVVHVQWLDCSGLVGGPGTKTGPGIGSDVGSCTPVPEPITMFLGGTGLLVMGYVARKRLFGMGRSWAV